MENKEPKLWEILRALEEDHQNIDRQYASAKATMIVNFGKEAHEKSPYKDLINDSDTLNTMIIKVFEHLHEKVVKRASDEDILYCKGIRQVQKWIEKGNLAGASNACTDLLIERGLGIIYDI